MFDDKYSEQMCVRVRPILTQSKFNRFHVHMCLRKHWPCVYYFTIRHSSCSGVVVYLVTHGINQIRNDWRLMIIYSICYVEIHPHRVSQFQALTYILFYFTVICIVIKSHQLNQIYSTTLRSFIGCEYSSYYSFFKWYVLQCMYMNKVCCLITIYTTYLNSTTSIHMQFDR
jgi:hypothetical protein